MSVLIHYEKWTTTPPPLHPRYDLDIMQPGQDLTEVTCNVLRGLRDVFMDFKPDRVLVHGDTSTTLAASLAAYYAQTPVGHVEAGLRTGNIYSPWPEDLLLCIPPKYSVANTVGFIKGKSAIRIHRDILGTKRMISSYNVRLAQRNPTFRSVV